MDQINVGQIVADLSIDDKNSDKVMAKARDAMEKVAGELKRLDAAYEKNAITTGTYLQLVAQVGNEYDKLAAGVQSAYARMAASGNPLGALNAKLAMTGSGGSKGAAGLMQFSYAIDDLQYGLGAVVNNIGPVAAGLGLGMGIAGTAQIAAVGVNILYNNWDKMRAAWGDTSGIDAAKRTVDGLSESVKELTTAIDTAGQFTLNPFAKKITEASNDQLRAEVDRLKAMKAADANAAKMDEPEIDEDAKKRVVDAVKKAGGTTALARKMADAAIGRDGLEGLMTADERSEITAARMGRVDAKTGAISEDPGADAKVNAIRAKIRKRIDAQTAEFIGAAADDPAKAAALAARMAEIGLTKEAGVITGENATAAEVDADEKENERLTEERKRKREKAAKEAKAAEKKEGVERVKARRDELARDKEWREANNQLATLLMPELSADAKAAQDAIDAGGSADDEQASLASRLQKAGMSAPDAAEAARDAMSAQAKVDPVAREKRRQAEAKQAQSARDAAAREAMEKARDALPGIGDIAEAGALNAMAGNVSMAEVAKRIKAELKRRGLSEEDAELAGNAATADGMRGAGERVMRKALSGREVSMSQTLAASDLTRQAQAGVASDGVVDTLKRMEDLLAEQVRNGKNVVQLRVDN